MNRSRLLLSCLVLGTAAIAGPAGYYLGNSGTTASSDDPSSHRPIRLFGGSSSAEGSQGSRSGSNKTQALSEQGIKAELKVLMGTADPVERMASLTRLLDNLNPSTLPAVLKAFDSIPMRPGYEQEYTLLLDAWASFDPEGAIEFVNEKANNRTLSKSMLLGASLNSWMRENPSKALEWFNNLPEEERSHQLTRGLLEGWATTDPKAAAEYILANHEQPGESRERLIGAVITQLLRKSTSAATEWAESMEDPKFREECFEELSESWVSLDPVGLSQWLGQYATEPFAKEAFEDLARGWVNVDSEAATDWMMALPEGEPKNSGVYEMVRTWAESDLTAVGEWLNTVEDSNATNMGVRAYAQNLLYTAPDSAVLSASSITNPELREQTLHELMPFWYQQNPEEAIAWAETNDYPVEILQNQGFSNGNLGFTSDQIEAIQRSMQENPEIQRQMEERMRGVIQEQFVIELAP